MLNVTITTGSEKQIAWAKDILEKPIKHIDTMLEIEHRPIHVAEYRVEAYNRAKDAYIKWITDGAAQMGGGFTADWVIKHRWSLIEAANKIIQREGEAASKEKGLAGCCLQPIDPREVR